MFKHSIDRSGDPPVVVKYYSAEADGPEFTGDPLRDARKSLLYALEEFGDEAALIKSYPDIVLHALLENCVIVRKHEKSPHARLQALARSASNHRLQMKIQGDWYEAGARHRVVNRFLDGDLMELLMEEPITPIERPIPCIVCAKLLDAKSVARHILTPEDWHQGDWSGPEKVDGVFVCQAAA